MGSPLRGEPDHRATVTTGAWGLARLRSRPRPGEGRKTNDGASRPPKKGRNVKMLFKRLAVSMATVGVLTSGMGMVAASEAMAAKPCGLSYTTGDVPGGPLKIVYYDIRNCHNYTVKRKLDIAGTTDDPCLTIGPGETVSRTRIIAGFAGVRGIKPC